MSLPHGSVDILCARLTDEDIAIQLGVIMDGSLMGVDNPQLVSVKNIKELSKCQYQPHMCVTSFLSCLYRLPNSGRGTMPW